MSKNVYELEYQVTVYIDKVIDTDCEETAEKEINEKEVERLVREKLGDSSLGEYTITHIKAEHSDTVPSRID